MLATMAKKKPAGQDRHTEPRESFHLSQELLDALVRYVGRTRPETSKSAVIRLALEEFLTRTGDYPVPPGESEGPALPEAEPKRRRRPRAEGTQEKGTVS
jgi:hypothetical protein